MSSRIKRVTLLQPASAGGNFEYIAIPRQGLLFLSGALKQWEGPFLYDREVWFEARSGKMDPDKDLEGVDILMVSCLINEAPRAYEVARLAKEAHPNLITIGGGPQMSPLPREAIELGKFDVIVNREGEDIIGQLCDVMLTLTGDARRKALSEIPGISYMDNGQLIQTLRRGLVSPDFVELPDFHAIRDLTPLNPMAGGVLETVRGCTEKCTYCQVIQQFLGYRMVDRETEIKRLHQLQELAADGLIHSRNGRFAVFVSDDLHPPPLRAVKYRNERLERIKAWKGHSDGMALVCQARAEVGQDPELAHALRDIGMGMLYLGVESDNVANLEAVRKRQEPGQMFNDLEALNSMGFSVVAMTIIGLPFDTEESIMDMAEWVTQISRYQTANLLTPLPATSNWTDLTPLDQDGNILARGSGTPLPPLYRRAIRSPRRALDPAGVPRPVSALLLQAQSGRPVLCAHIQHDAEPQSPRQSAAGAVSWNLGTYRRVEGSPQPSFSPHPQGNRRCYRHPRERRWRRPSHRLRPSHGRVAADHSRSGRLHD